MKQLFWTLVVAVAFLLGACSDSGGGPASITPPEDLLPVEAFDQVEPVLPNTYPEPGVECRWFARLWQAGGFNAPMFGQWALPGIIYQGRSFREQSPLDPVTLRRSGGTFVLLNPNGSSQSSVTVDEVTSASAVGAINELLRAIGPLAADFEISISQLRTREELAMALHASGSILDIFGSSADFEWSDNYRMSTFLVAFQQRFYTVAFDGKPSAVDYFAPGALAAYNGPQIANRNPPVVASTVTYGRSFYLLVQSTESAQTMSATLAANLQAGIFGGGGDGSLRYLTDASNVTIQAYAYGGEQGAVLDAVFGGLDSLNAFKDALKQGNDPRTALPLAYVMRSLVTNRTVEYAMSADYQYATCTFSDACGARPLSPVGIVIDNGCLSGDNTRWSFDWEPCTGATKYQIQVLKPDRQLFIDTEVVGRDSLEYETGGSFSALDGWRWRVRAFAFGDWQGWSDEAAFSLESLGTDCPDAGVWLYTHPSHGGDRRFIPWSSGLVIDLEAIDGWDDEIDSLQLVNIPWVELAEDPARFGYGIRVTINHSCPNVEEHGIPRNCASYLRFP